MDFWWGVIAAVLAMFAIGFMVAFVKVIMEIIRNIREEIRIDVQAILDQGFTSGMEKAAQIVREYRQASEAYAKEPEGGYMKGLWRAEMLIMDGGHGAS